MGSDREFELPASYLAMPRWWAGRDADWLAGLPGLVRDQCSRWRLDIAGPPMHGSNAIVVPVAGGTDLFALRIAPPGPQIAGQIAALRFWDGRGTVRLFRTDAERGALLLEWVPGGSLRSVPVAEAVVTLGRMMHRLAVPAPPQARSTGDLAAARLRELEADWYRLGRPFDRVFLTRAVEVGIGLCAVGSDRAVNGDLHSEQVPRGSREPWLVVDPVLLRGDVAYDLARVLWTRIDEMSGPAEVLRHFDAAVREGDLDRDRARDWVVFRSVDYWLWGLNVGLTEDPRRCRALLRAFAT
jgi:streptomycin 6-kinase